MKLKSTFLFTALLFCFHWQAQAQTDCSQEQVSNNFENGLFMEAGGQLLANDIVLSASVTSLSVETITANLLSQGGIATVDILIFEDEEGFPGAQIGTTIEDLTPTSQDIIGEAFSYDVYEVVFDLPTAVDLAGSGTAESISYWVQIIATPTVVGSQVAWEVTTADVIGYETLFDNATGTWGYSAGNDGVFTVDGTCTYVACPAPTDLTSTPISTTETDVSWTELGTATEWEIEFGAVGFEPGTGTIISDTDGTIGESITGLTAGTQYEYYVTAICGVEDESFATGPYIFATPVCDPADQCDYTFSLIDDWGDGWGDGYMEVTQNGIVVATLTLSDGELLDVTVPLCDGVEYELFWTAGGGIFSYEVGISITDPFGVPVFNMIPGSGTPETSLFISTGNCTEPSCYQPIDLAVTDITTNSAVLSWDTLQGAVNGFEWFVFADGADPLTDTPIATGTTDAGVFTATATDLVDQTEYDFYVVADCDTDGLSNTSGPMSFVTLPNPPVNDNLSGAIMLTVDEACSGDAYSNFGATVETGEPIGECHFLGDAAQTTVWFSFVAESNAAIITTDISPAELNDAQLTVYEAPSDVNDITTLGEPIGCDEDGGIEISLMSIVELNNLTPGETYYIQVDGYNGTEGAFCIEVIDYACPEPNNFAVNNVTDLSADVTWNAGGIETEWEVEYGSAGFTPGEGTILTDNDGTPGITLNDLEPGTSYDVYVTAVCTDENSVQIGPASFTTFGAGMCGQMQVSNNFENALFNQEGGQLLANDFIVSGNTGIFSVERVTANIFTQGGIESVDILFFEDNAGLPGDQIGATLENIIPTSQEIVGTAFGFDAHEMVIDFDTPIEFEGSETGDETTYWMQIIVIPTVAGTQAGWEVTTASIIGNQTIFDNLTGVWAPSVGNDGVFTIEGNCFAVGIEDQVFEDFTFYPNPAGNQIHLSSTKEITEVSVYDLVGKKVIQKSTNSLNPTINLEQLNSGAYLIQITINESVKTFKFIKA